MQKMYRLKLPVFHHFPVFILLKWQFWRVLQISNLKSLFSSYPGVALRNALCVCRRIDQKLRDQSTV